MSLLKKVVLASLLGLFISSLAAEQLFAQYFFFGKNRVQYETFDWRYIETDHFDIYYYNSKNYHLAQFTAETVESSLEQFENDFGSQLTDRIPVIIYDSHSDFSQTNVVQLPVDAQGIGGVTDKYKNRMTQPFMGEYADFRRTIQHELTHAFINDVYYGGNVQSIVQNNIQLRFPLWFEEGLAEYLALRWDTNTDMFMRDAVLNDYLPPLQRLGGYFAYRGGQSFWYYIETEYGRPKITEILERVKLTRNVQQAIEQSVGLNVEELSERWDEFYRQRYFPEVANRQTLSSTATQITGRNNGRSSYNTSPAISPNGDLIAMISNRRGVFDVIVVDANTGKKLKTIVSGSDSPMFEELNILNPNLAWSPDGRRITLSSKSQGSYNLAIVDYETKSFTTTKFPSLDAINSVAWSPDGSKIAFDGNIGPYQSIFVYNIENDEFLNLTGDVFTDKEPAWASDSETVYFVSNRGDALEPHTYLAGSTPVMYDSFFETDIYSMNINSSRIQRLTNTVGWSENQPTSTRDGRLLFVSDQNGIPNIYEYDLSSRTVYPLTDLQSGVMQISVSYDGTRLAFNALNEGSPDVYVIRSPFSRRMEEPLEPNQWAQQRAQWTAEQRVPAIGYARKLISERDQGNVLNARRVLTEAQPERSRQNRDGQQAESDTTNRQQDSERIDFRNYQFGESVVRDTTLELRDDPRNFEPDNNTTENGLYRPKDYRLQFSPDLSYAAGQVNTYSGSSAIAFVTLSDLFGNHQLTLGTDLTFDLRNSDYLIQYGFLKNRTNFYASFNHQSRNYQTFFGELIRFRTFSLNADFQYPLNRYQRFDYGVSAIGIYRDFASVRSLGTQNNQNDNSFFLNPSVTFTGDYTIPQPGSITPGGGSRYSVRLSGSPYITNSTPQFATILGDYRKYFDLGNRTSFAFRGSGAYSIGRDSQTFFMGGMLGWINQRWSDAEIPFDRLADTFFTLPATPLRGHEFNTTFGDRFSLLNAEFRFPLFAAVLPGPIPLIPLYNITGVAFVDAGAAWGFNIPYSRFTNQNGEPIVFEKQSPELDFTVASKEELFLNPSTGLQREGPPQEGDIASTIIDGDILIGAGFGLRTILLGLPFRYDVGWPYFRDGFDGNPIHYFSIGIDF
ncbi:MAG TPA: hypothetical protein VJ915_07660 [Balneolaceae bacterium]|nr:hypothetical protein [Balneolaceae bacterium]